MNFIQIIKSGVTNSFGDQEYEIVLEDIKGNILASHYELNHEGNHISFLQALENAKLTFKQVG